MQVGVSTPSRAPKFRGRQSLAIVVLGVVAGLLASADHTLVAVAVAIVALAVAFALAPDKGSLTVGLYWATLSIRTTIFSNVNIGGLFFPFYAAFFLVLFVRLSQSRLSLDRRVLWALVAFFAVTGVSFIGFGQPIDSAVIQKLTAIILCALVMLSTGTHHGALILPALAILSGVAISVWVIINSAQTGFAYRGGIEVNQNVAAFVLGVAFVVLVAVLLSPTRPRGFAFLVLSLLFAGGMAYALLLLASRGMTVAIAVTVLMLVIRATIMDRRTLRIVFGLLVFMVAGFFLPGGAGLLDRFAGESVDSAGDRTPIWTAVVRAYVESSPSELVLGHGFNGSVEVVQNATGSLTSTHNTFLTILYEFGVIGLLLFLLLHALPVLRSLRDTGPLGLVVLGLMVLLLTASLSASLTEDFPYWVILGYCLGVASLPPRFPVRNQERRPSRSHNPDLAAIT